MAQFASFTRIITEQDIKKFISLTGDDHPIHVDEKYAKNKGFSSVLVHGMLVASLFSTLIGKYHSNQNYMYISQNLIFHKPVYPNTKLVVKGTILSESTIGIMTIKTEILSDQGILFISGVAKIKKI